MAKHHQQRRSMGKDAGRQDDDSNQKKEVEMDRTHAKKITQ